MYFIFYYILIIIKNLKHVYFNIILLYLYYTEAQENADEYSNEVEQLRGTVARNEEEKQRLEAELVQVKEMLQREVARADAESRRSNIIIAEYKQVNIYIMFII